MKVKIVEALNTTVSIVKTLARFYAYEMTAYTGFPCPEDGLFFCRDDAYWRDPTNTYFLIKVDDEIAGFAVIDHIGANQIVDANVADFLVLPKFRRRGVGTRSACQIFNNFNGNWEVMQLPENSSAISFWTSVIRQYTCGRYTTSQERTNNYGKNLVVHRFNNGWRMQMAKKV